MTTQMILIVAILVFTLMVIGLVLTIKEFRSITRGARPKQGPPDQD